MITAILAAIPALAAIFGVFKYWSSIVLWWTTKTTDQKNQDIDTSVENEEKNVDSGGRPKWN